MVGRNSRPRSKARKFLPRREAARSEGWKKAELFFRALEENRRVRPSIGKIRLKVSEGWKIFGLRFQTLEKSSGFFPVVGTFAAVFSEPWKKSGQSLSLRFFRKYRKHFRDTSDPEVGRNRSKGWKKAELFFQTLEGWPYEAA